MIETLLLSGLSTNARALVDLISVIRSLISGSDAAACASLLPRLRTQASGSAGFGVAAPPLSAKPVGFACRGGVAAQRQG
jgi:hypothetical protein